jgi:hypothetical protein
MGVNVNFVSSIVFAISCAGVAAGALIGAAGLGTRWESFAVKELPSCDSGRPKTIRGALWVWCWV